LAGSTFSFDKVNHVITVVGDDTEITIQELVDACREWEDGDEAMEVMHVIDAAGKEVLGGGVSVGITCTLRNWKVKFADRGSASWVLCNIRGGNLVAVNQLGVPMSPIEPAAYVTVSLTASASATLQELLDIQYSSFEGGVWIDLVNGTPGTDYPTGTRRQPVDNLLDAHIIGTVRGLNEFRIIGDLTVGATDDVDNHIIIGETQLSTSITFVSGCSTRGTEIHQASLQGTLDGTICIHDCCIYELIGLEGNVYTSSLLGDITLAGVYGEVVNFFKCISALVVVGLVTIDMGGDGPALSMRGHVGSIKVKNKTGDSKLVIEFLSGRVSLTDTVTAGNVLLRGVGFIKENLATGITLDTDGLVQGTDIAILKKIQTNRWKIVNNQFIIYDDDGSTPIYTFSLKNQAGDPTMETPYERVPT